MCQDNIKIREEGELENESVQNVLKQPLIIRKVLESLDFPSLLHCRIVSKSWEKEATFIMSKRCKVTIKDLESLQDLINIYPLNNSDQATIGIVETFLFSHVTFQFDIESEAKKKPAPSSLQTFLTSHAKQLSSLETPTGSVRGTDSVSEWAEKLLGIITDSTEQINEDSKLDEEKIKDTKDIITDDNNNNNIIAPAGKDEQPAILDENANFISERNENALNAANLGNINKMEDESCLQEIIIHDDEIEKQVASDTKIQLSSASLEKPRKSVHFSMVENPDYVPIPYCDEGYSNFADFYPYYLGEHSNGAARRLHILGITNSIILIIIGTFTLNPILYAVAIVQAYALAIGSHYYFERRIPRPTIRNPLYMTMGNLKMWWEVASGKRAL